MGLIREMGAVAIMIPVLVTVFFAVGIIFFITMLLRKVTFLGKLRGPAVMFGALAATTVVCVGLTYYLTRLAVEDSGTREALKNARNTIAQMKPKLDAAASLEEDLAAAKQRAADLEKTVGKQADDLSEARARLDETLRFVSADKAAGLVSSSGKLTDAEVASLADLHASIVKPAFRRSRVVVKCPMKYVTPGSTFALKAGKESFTPGEVAFDAGNWVVTLTFYDAATAQDAMRFAHSEDITLAVDNKANPRHVEAVFTKAGTTSGWFSSTTAFSLSSLRIGPTRITRTKDGWSAETDEEPEGGVISNFLRSLWDKL